MNFADAGLMQQLYCKINLNESLNNMIHIHFDKLTAQASMFYESAVSDKLPGFKYGNIDIYLIIIYLLIFI